MTPNSRSYLNRFLSPDSIISDQYNPLDWDRFSYARNNPVRYTDPTGHMVDDGCDTEGCDIDKIGTEYEKKLHYYQNCESGEGGGCPDYSGAITFTVTGLVTAGTAGTLLNDVGMIVVEWVASVVSSVTTFFCLDGDCGNEFDIGTHALERMEQRQVSIDQLQKALQQEPFRYFHDGIWKLGYYDPVSRVFVGVSEFDRLIRTVIGNVTPGYIINLKKLVGP